MIIMINGAFGAGKTTIANELHKELENSMIYDPEVVGYMLRHVIPEKEKRMEAGTGDFQDLQLWRDLTVEVAKRLVGKYRVDLIVPMTIRKMDYFDVIKSGFEEIDEDTHHFCLTASKETIYKRLKARGEEEGNWCFQQTDKCLKAFQENNFGEYIDTENVSVGEVVGKIKEKLNIDEMGLLMNRSE
ncbi:AAA family ATPase [Rossellomorea aquimaris]|uniref:AAA family ATPase n=1 Tax=Rossellomorea aquimaris TaxID=189382 RepID=UPI0005CA0108|nr:AAA family ATPase [Rossellomorea aquimaris]